MPTQRLVIADVKTGLETDRTPFIINNDAFPKLENAYVWRGRILRKRGDQLLGRLERGLTASSIGNTGASPWTFNIYSTIVPSITGQANAQIVPGTVVITISAGPIVFTDQGNGTLTSPTPGNSGTINYSTGSVTLIHTAGAGVSTTITLRYYPVLPVMGIEDFNVGNSPQPIPITFDTMYSYGFDQGLNRFYDVTFYKATKIPFTWNGANYEQFWTTNYLGPTTISNVNNPSGCLWATNGEPGFHYLLATYTAGTGTATWNITFTDPGGAPFQTLKVGDILWFNEWAGSTDVNGVSGTVSAIVNAALGQYQVTFASAKNVAVTLTGIVQMMTNFLPNQNGIRWYDGDPNLSAPPNNLGWVNFAPPLSAYDPVTNPHPTYLVGAKLVLPFKNRLLFFAVYLRTSAASPGVQFFPNRVVYSQVGTPFYTNPLPFDIATSTPDVTAWYQNVAGKGGFIAAPIDDQLIVVMENEDILITIFESQPLKLIYTSDDTLPFIFQTVSAELGSLSTFSAVKLDTGVLSVGSYGITMCTSTSVQRIDLQIPDQVFDFGIANNNPQRVAAVRDYQKEFVYFTYAPGIVQNKTFPSQTLLYNYRENNWAIFKENYTTYGTFRRTTNRTWSNIGQYYPTWEEWTDFWDFGANEAFFPVIVGGNQHGFIMQKGLSVFEGPSEIIQSISGNIVTSPSHGLNTGDFIEISGMIGSTNLNGTIQQIVVLTENTFSINEAAVGTYLGGGVFARLSRPIIQTKQFPLYWDAARGARIGTSRFLLDTTATGAITVNIFSSQNANTPSNDPLISPYIPFTTTVLTCAEPSLYSSATPPWESQQAQIWHRLNTSINGDTVQLGFTLSDLQMRNEDINQQDIIIHAIVMDLYPGPALGL